LANGCDDLLKQNDPYTLYTSGCFKDESNSELGKLLRIAVLISYHVKLTFLEFPFKVPHPVKARFLMTAIAIEQVKL